MRLSLGSLLLAIIGLAHNPNHGASTSISMLAARSMAHSHVRTICKDCISIFQGAASMLFSASAGRYLLPFDTSYRTRLATNVSSSSCHMCVLLHTSIPRLLGDLNTEEDLVLNTDRDRHDRGAVRVGLIGSNRKTPQQRILYDGSVRIQDVKHGCVNDLVSPTTWSLETLRTMWSWVRNCISFHDKCSKRRVVSRLPLRLIDVMSVDLDNLKSADEMSMTDFEMLSLNEQPGVRIISTNSLALDTPYLTLSHRWGNPPSLLLTSNTKYLLHGDITPHLLSCGEATVFRHAIHVTRALAFRYIWIDALCIMQDDDSEKTIEIMQMDQIYLNSTLNISAAEAQSRDGLVFDRDILSTNPCGAKVKVSEATEDAHLKAFPNEWYLRPSEAPLYKRGWVFQERMLAPRIIHFTKNQVFWECHSLEASEVLPQGIPSEPARLNKGVETSSHSTKEHVGLRWYELVEAYSRTELSFADDRLLAISALAKQCCLRMGLDASDYLAGMWKTDLPLSMLWCQRSRLDVVTSKSTVIVERTMKHAPSWSWASLLTEVEFVSLSNLVATTEVVDVGIKRISPNFYGGADSCRLRLRGRICRFRREVRDNSTWIHIGQHTKFQEFENFEFQRGKVMILSWDTSRPAVSNFLSTDGSISAVSTYAFLHMASEHSVDGILERGVILQRTAVYGTYMRVGTFFTPFKSEYPGSELEKAFQGLLETLSPEEYLELDLNGRYTVDVV